MALGRRHDRRVLSDSVEDALRAMDRAGVQRALVYSPVSSPDPVGANRRLLELLADEPRLVPQFVCSPVRDAVEASTSWGDHGTIKFLVDGAGDDRVLFGSDMPEQDARYQVGMVVTADISDDAKRKVLGLNAIEVLGLDLGGDR